MSWTVSRPHCACSCPAPALTLETKLISGHANVLTVGLIFLPADEAANRHDFDEIEWGEELNVTPRHEDGSDDLLSTNSSGNLTGTSITVNADGEASLFQRCRYRVRYTGDGLTYRLRLREVRVTSIGGVFSYSVVSDTEVTVSADVGETVTIHEAEMTLADNAGASTFTSINLVGGPGKPPVDFQTEGAQFSLSKVGFLTYATQSGAPPKIYRRETAAGSSPGCAENEEEEPDKTYSGYQRYVLDGFVALSYVRESTLSAEAEAVASPSFPQYAEPRNRVDTVETRVISRPFRCGGVPKLDKITQTLTEEFTTTDLREQVDAAVEAAIDAGDVSGGAPTATKVLSGDEVRYERGRCSFAVGLTELGGLTWGLLTDADVTMTARWIRQTRDYATGAITEAEETAELTVTLSGVSITGGVSDSMDLDADEGKTVTMVRLRIDPPEGTVAYNDVFGGLYLEAV